MREIVNVMAGKESDSAPDFRVKYRVRDLECDSLEDLEKIGGSARNFEILVVKNNGESFLRLEMGMAFLSLGCPQDEALYQRSKISEIFEANSIWWKQVARDFVSRVPYWVLICAVAACLLIPYFDPKYGGGYVASHFFSWRMWIVPLVFFYFVLWRGSVVRLRYLHSSNPKKWIRDHATQLAFLALSAVLGALAKEMISPLKAWFSHLFH